MVTFSSIWFPYEQFLRQQKTQFNSSIKCNLVANMIFKSPTAYPKRDYDNDGRIDEDEITDT